MTLEQFKKNYTGILVPEVAYAEAVAKAEVAAGKFKNATYDPDYNKQLEKQYIASAGVRAGAKY